MLGINPEPYTIGPDGERLTVADLPDANEQRWVPRRKARVVAAVAGGLITREVALDRYRLTPEEFEKWQIAITQSGLRGLHLRRDRAPRSNHEWFEREADRERTAPMQKAQQPGDSRSEFMNVNFGLKRAG